jgi:hypothetical protein
MANTLDKIKLSGVTYDIIDSTAVHSLDGYATTGDVTAATAALAETIAEQHYQTSGDVQSAITEAVSGKADASDVITEIVGNVYGGNGNYGITYTKNGSNTNKLIFGIGDGLKVGSITSTFEVDFTKVAKKTDIPSVSGYADAVAYDTNSKEMKFYHGGTGGTEVFSFDASPFLIDGMVQNVEIKDVEISGETVTCLVISFNTDAGKQDINIPISEIFDASNYYTTAQTDSAIEAATSGKADTSAVTESIEAATSGKVDTTAYTAYTAATDAALSGKLDTTTFNTYSGSVDTALSGKQETLVSGTNIKTVGGNSLLGSGDIAWPAGMTASVSGTTLIFS